MNNSVTENKLNSAWNKLFREYDILNRIEKNGKYEISTETINQFREARLITKFDHSKNLPEIFKANQLSILPITTGSYVISHFDTYHVFEEIETPLIKFKLPSYLQSLNYENVNSESIALNKAFVSGIITDFTEDDELLPTVSGRMRSGNFVFNIYDIFQKSKQTINVINSQIEIDAAYEGINFLSIFEAKNDISDDFLVRQLYYPYRTWSNRITKKIKPIFLMFSNGIYRLYEYNFADIYDYSSLELVKHKNYAIVDDDISVSDIENILENIRIVDEPEISFPQADSIERVINLCELLSEKDINRDEVTKKYDFDARQTNYYTDAGRYLGLIIKNKDGSTPIYSISSLAKKILNFSYKERQLSYCKCILSHKVFNDVLKSYLSNGFLPDKKQIISYMKKANLYNIQSEQTFARRASTIRHWIEWIVGLINN